MLTLEPSIRQQLHEVDRWQRLSQGNCKLNLLHVPTHSLGLMQCKVFRVKNQLVVGVGDNEPEGFSFAVYQAIPLTELLMGLYLQLDLNHPSGQRLHEG